MNPIKRYFAELYATRDRRALYQALRAQLRAAGHAPDPTKLYRLLDQGITTPALTTQIKSALSADQAERFMAAVKANTPAPATEPLPEFPFLWVLNERSVPSPIFVVALTGIHYWKTLSLPQGLGDAPREVQHEQIAERVRHHFRERGDSSAAFGPVIGYVYVPAPRRSHFVNTAGVLDPMNLGPFHRPRVWVGASFR